ncbi:TonB-dependent receptor [Aliikangiella coralliicola]|uniref:TonB-dependent receptor n=1 Tax=Aliikangiella coralliicola TaxID=2592383 RepID=A0A545UD68_9GAMM|nr:TonB-dependent receptor [Aliikangiella coralliicola]TQV87408.1 TonB-dependent receptor [Aliikangiella coralliicola]
MKRGNSMKQVSPRFKLTLIATAISLACSNNVVADQQVEKNQAPQDSQSTTDSGSSSTSEQQQPDSPEQEEQRILVTANRRSQSIESVPYNISAIGGGDLKQIGISNLGELTQRIPGVSYTDKGARTGAFSTSIAMRGLSLEDGRVSGPLYTAPGVSTYVGETPLFSNIRFYDIDRVEILRGPQGTLYGSGSLGGTLRFIPNRPDLMGTDGEISYKLGQTDNGDGLNSELNLVYNLPISDTVALRANVGRSESAGWIDQPRAYQLDAQGIPVAADTTDALNSPSVFQRFEGTNDEESTYGRVSLLWEATSDVEVLLAYNSQKDDSGGNPSRAVDYLDLGEYESAALSREPYAGDTDLLSLDVEVDLGFATFTASASNYESEQELQSDQTGAYQAFDFYAASYGAMPRPYIADFATNNDSANILEMRLVSQDDGDFSWVVGAFYMEQDIEISNFQFFRGYADWADACAAAGRDDCGLGTTTGAFSLIFDPGTHPVADAAGLPVLKDQNFLSGSTAKFTDRAIFGELTWHVSDDWQITGGIRAFDQEFDNEQVNAAFFVDTASRSRQVSSEDDVLFKFNTSYQIGEDSMIYFTNSEGFRRGGANALPDSVTVFDDLGNATVVQTNPNLLSYAPDQVTNRELGLKGRIGDFRYSTALFDIEWDKVQLDSLVTPFLLNAVVNAGTAKSQGLEAELNTVFNDELEITFGYSYVDATLDKPDTFGLTEAAIDPATVRGQRLPGVPKHTASIDVSYLTEVGNWFVIYGVNGNYRSDSRSQLNPATSTTTEGFSMWNSYVSFENDNWAIRLFVNNLANEEGIINTPSLGPNGPRRNELISRPRTIGVNVQYVFE